MQGLTCSLIASISPDGSYCFVDELVLTIDGDLFGASDATSEARLVLSEVIVC